MLTEARLRVSVTGRAALDEKVPSATGDNCVAMDIATFVQVIGCALDSGFG